MRTKRTKIKRLWSFLLAAVMSLALVSTSAIADEQAGGAGTDIVNDVDSSGNGVDAGTNNADDTGINNPDGTGTNNSDGSVDESPDVITSYTVNVTLPPSYEDEEEVFKCADNSGALEQAISEGGAIENIVLTYDMGEYPDASALSEMMMSWADAVNAALTDTGLTAAYNAENNTIVISGTPAKDVNLNLEEVLGNYDAEPLVDGTHEEHCICGNHKTSGCDDVKLTWIAVENINDISADGNYYLTQDQTLSSTWTCDYDVNLCLNGKTITGASNVDTIKVAGGATLAITDCSADDAVGKITHPRKAYGTGINNCGTLTLWNGSVSGNTFWNGDIRETNWNYGAGVNNSGTFTMMGGSISGNTTYQGGGGVYNSGKFTLKGGSISNNYTCYDGGGVYNGSEFNMTGGTISKNTAKNGGGKGYGGGVYNYTKCTFNMTGGSITENSSELAGGGVYNYGHLIMTGGSITQNYAVSYGGGMCCTFWENGGSFTISGNPTIAENTGSGNVYLSAEGYTIAVASSGMDESAKVGISSTSPGSYPTVITGTTDDTGFFCDNSTYELVDNGSGGLRLNQHIHCVCGKTNCSGDGHNSKASWKGVSNLSKITSDGNYYLKSDIELNDTWTCNYDVNLCLNGKTIYGADEKEVIKITSNGSLTITDCNDNVGSIAHKEGEEGSGITNNGKLTLVKGNITGNTSYVEGGGVRNKGTFTMTGGSIRGNVAELQGGGVSNTGTFEMSGGEIAGNTLKMEGQSCGGGVFNYNGGKFNMTGGCIGGDSDGDGNSAKQYGGGVCNNHGTVTIAGKIVGNSADQGGGVYNFGKYGTVEMTGGSILNNTATTAGGGVYMYSGTFTVSGSTKIYDNNGGNVYLPSDKTITVGDKGLDDDAYIGITGTKDQTVVSGTTSGANFFSDNDSYLIVTNDAKNGLKLIETEAHNHCVCGKDTAVETTHKHDTTTSWKALSGNIGNELKDGNYYLYEDVMIDSDELMISGTVNLCLNGKTITGANGEQVIFVNKDASLSITDCRAEAGSITHKKGESGIGIVNEGTLTLWNGNITGNTSGKNNYDYSGGVINFGTFTMNGGTISDNGLAYYGGGVANCGIFTMNDGTIANNSALWGGGVLTMYNTYGPSKKIEFTMNGGSITGNEAKISGGGVANGGRFIMTGGSITGNKAQYLGGGVHNAGVEDDEGFEMTGGSITGNEVTEPTQYNGEDKSYGGGVANSGAIKLSGEVNITGNKCATKDADGKTSTVEDNVCLYNVADDDEEEYIDPTITADRNLAKSSRVGVNAYVPEVNLTVVNGSTDTGVFTSDDTDYDLIDNENGGLKLSYKISGVTVKNSADGAEMTDGKKVYDGKAVAYTEGTLTPSGDGAVLTYTWQIKSGDTYVDIEGNAAPSAVGSYRLLVSAVKDGEARRTVEYQFEITKEDEPVTPDDPDSGKGGSDGSGSADSGNSGSGSANSGANNSGTAVSGGAANTGDESNMMLWIMLMILGGAGFVSIARVIRKFR